MLRINLLVYAAVNPALHSRLDCNHRVAGTHYCAPAPKEPCVKVSLHTAQA
jgi:hypothetical protein